MPWSPAKIAIHRWSTLGLTWPWRPASWTATASSWPREPAGLVSCC
eukprot:gene23053-27397_t